MNAYGDHIILRSEELTDETLKQVKGLYVQQICHVIEQLAEDHDDFLYIEPIDESRFKVGWKIICPTLGEKD